jgi:Leucine-rich repeat (LRR) protein
MVTRHNISSITPNSLRSSVISELSGSSHDLQWLPERPEDSQQQQQQQQQATEHEQCTDEPHSVDGAREDAEERDSLLRNSNNDCPASETGSSSLFGRVCTYLQCIVGPDEKEQDPFSQRRLWFIFVVALLSIVINLIVMPIALARMDKGSASSTASPTITPSRVPPPPMSPTVSPTIYGQTYAPTKQQEQVPTAVPLSPGPMPPNLTVPIALPPFTLEKINNPATPQYKAFQWLIHDPNIASYTTSRIMQRMGLATFFFATNGPFQNQTQIPQTQQQKSSRGIDPDVFGKLFDGRQHQNIMWNQSTHWLSYDIHECFWFSYAPFVCDAKDYYRYLTFPNNNLVGTIPAEISLLPRLQQIELSHNGGIYGPIPTHVGFLAELQDLKLSYLPYLSGTLPDTITNLHVYLQRIHLQETPFFVKTLSPSIGKLTRLQELLLDTHTTKGDRATSQQATLPVELGNMHALRNFTISGQEVIGTLPTEIARLSWLEWLHIADTRVTGTIPQDFGSLTSLTKLQLMQNQIRGALPWELSKLRETLTSLSLNLNFFSGTIPDQYSNLIKCKFMALQNNELSGTVPLGLCNLLDDESLHALRVDCLDGQVQCSCDCECF